MPAQVGTGTTVTFSGFTQEIVNIDNGGLATESIDTSHLGTTEARTFIGGDLYDPGELTMEVNHDPTYEPVIGGDPAAISLDQHGLGAGNIWTGEAFLQSYNPSWPLENKMTATAVFKMSGGVSIA